jgi:hypothetical protein
MRFSTRLRAARVWLSGGLGALALLGMAGADAPRADFGAEPAPAVTRSEGDSPAAARQATRSTRRRLRVVVPTGLLASGATGQFGGGLGGPGGGGFGGGGFGGAGLGGGGLGGGGLGGGGLGGGTGGFGGGGFGGQGGGLAGQGAGVLPASVGMTMLGRVIMNHAGERSSWDATSLYSGGFGAGQGAGNFGGGPRPVGFRSAALTGPHTTPAKARKGRRTTALPVHPGQPPAGRPSGF